LLMRERRGGTVPKVRPDRCHEQGSEHDGREDRRPDAGLRPRDRFDRRDSHADHVLLTSRTSMYSGTRTIYGRRDLPMCDLRPTSENVVSSISNPGITVPSGGDARHTPWRTMGTADASTPRTRSLRQEREANADRDALEEADQDRPDGRGDRDHEVEPMGPPELSQGAHLDQAK